MILIMLSSYRQNSPYSNSAQNNLQKHSFKVALFFFFFPNSEGLNQPIKSSQTSLGLAIKQLFNEISL